VIILDVDIGLYIGIAWSLVMIIIRTQRARMSVLGNLPDTEMYESHEICEKVRILNLLL
jgi:MFS superfamily sulfate permease-like transporter